MVTTDSPGMDSERRVASPAEPLTAFSIGRVTSSSTCCGAKPGASVCTSTCVGTNSGNTSSGTRMASRQPRRNATALSAVTAP